MTRSVPAILVATLFCGCMQTLENQTKKTEKSKVIGKKTQDIGEFDPNAGAKVSDSKINATDPVTAPMSVLASSLERLPKLQIEDTLNKFNALEGRYPNSHDEFMTRIIKENNIQLPVLPGGKKYQYDVANHQLVVIEAPTDAAP